MLVMKMEKGSHRAKEVGCFERASYSEGSSSTTASCSVLDLLNCRIINVCCSKAPSLWSVVTAAIGN